jgi:hypothetical protein
MYFIQASTPLVADLLEIVMLHLMSKTPFCLTWDLLYLEVRPFPLPGCPTLSGTGTPVSDCPVFSVQATN